MFIAFPIKAYFRAKQFSHSMQTIEKYDMQCNFISLASDIEGCAAKNASDAVDTLVKFVKQRLSTMPDVVDKRVKISDFDLIYDVVSVNNGRCWSPGAMQRTRQLTD
jgi:hypothetical protein